MEAEFGYCRFCQLALQQPICFKQQQYQRPTWACSWFQLVLSSFSFFFFFDQILLVFADLTGWAIWSYCWSCLLMLVKQVYVGHASDQPIKLRLYIAGLGLSCCFDQPQSWTLLDSQQHIHLMTFFPAGMALQSRAQGQEDRLSQINSNLILTWFHDIFIKNKKVNAKRLTPADICQQLMF